MQKFYLAVSCYLHDCNSKGVIFGELTFTSASGLLGNFTTDALIKMNPNTK